MTDPCSSGCALLSSGNGCRIGNESEWHPLHRHELAGIRLRFSATRKVGITIRYPAELEGDHYGIRGQLCCRTGLFYLVQNSCQPRPIALANSTARSRPTAPSGRVKSARDSKPHTATIPPLIAGVSVSAFDPAARAKTRPTSLPKQAAKARPTIQDHRGK